MKKTEIENGDNLPPGYRRAPEIDRGKKSGPPLALALIRPGHAPLAALLRGDDGNTPPRTQPTMDTRKMPAPLTTAAEAAEAAESLEARPGQLDNYILALGHWRAMGTVDQPVLVPESLGLYHVRTLVGDYEVNLHVWAADKTSAAWIAGAQARASVIGSAEVELIKQHIEEPDTDAGTEASR